MPFERIKKPEFEPLDQTPPVSEQADTHPIEQAEEQELSRAENIVQVVGKTVEFSKFLVGLLDERLKDVSIVVDPEQEPEAWMALQRIMGPTANQNMAYDSYVQVLEALRDVYRLEIEESQAGRSVEDEFINSIPKTGETPDHPTPEMDYILEDDAAIEEAITPKAIRIPPGDEPPPPPPPPSPPRWWLKYLRRGRIIRWRNGQSLDRLEYLELLRREQGLGVNTLTRLTDRVM